VGRVVPEKREKRVTEPPERAVFSLFVRKKHARETGFGGGKDVFFQPQAKGKRLDLLGLSEEMGVGRSSLCEKKRKKGVAKKSEIRTIQLVEALSQRRTRLTEQGGRERRRFASSRKK
jgi:hypothetical protein